MDCHDLIIASSLDLTQGDFYGRLIASATRVVAVDGGVAACRMANRPPDLLIGDMDSAASADVAWATDRGSELERLLGTRHETDLATAVSSALATEADRRVATGVLGGRLDHELASLGALFASNRPWTVCEPSATAWVLPQPANLRLSCRPETIFSLLPWTDRAVLTVSGVEYPLDRETLAGFSSQGVSNVATSTEVSVVVHSGSLLVVVPDLDSSRFMGYAIEQLST